jgi:hypothetical protein
MFWPKAATGHLRKKTLVFSKASKASEQVAIFDENHPEGGHWPSSMFWPKAATSKRVAIFEGGHLAIFAEGAPCTTL